MSDAVPDRLWNSAKQLAAAWRVLLGVWSPKNTELSITALQQYLTPKTPPENPWIDKNKPTAPNAQAPTSESAQKASTASSHSGQAKAKGRGHARSPPIRRLIRHVLRARARAVHALASFFDEIERAPEWKRVYASVHLAQTYGGFSNATADDALSTPQGWRTAHEVLKFLRERGAKFASLESQIADDYWAESRAILSDPEEETEYNSDFAESSSGNDNFKWVAPAIQ